MAGKLCGSIAVQFEKTINITRKLIRSFSEEQWMHGISDFEVPAKVAYHLVDCLDLYFRENREGKYPWGHKFGGSWEELSDEEQPSQEAVIGYLEEMASRIESYFDSISDTDLATAYNEKITVLGHCIYAVRHTMHHQGALTALAVYHNCDPDVWE